MRALGSIAMVIFLFSFLSLIFNFVAGKILKKEKFAKLIKMNLFFTLGAFAISLVAIALDDSVPTEPEKQVVQVIEKKVEEKEAEKKVEKLEGNMKLSNENRKLKVELSTNSPDGTIFIVFITTANFDSLSENLIIKNGKAEKIFDIPKKWGDVNIGVSATMTFNNPEIVQPEETKAFYQNVSDTLDIKTIDIPSPMAVQEAKEKFYHSQLTEIKKISEGLILDFDEYNQDDSLLITVIFDDMWYHIAKYEKERIINSIDTSIKSLNTARGYEEHRVVVIYKDSYGKELIKRKIFGGFEVIE